MVSIALQAANLLVMQGNQPLCSSQPFCPGQCFTNLHSPTQVAWPAPVHAAHLFHFDILDQGSGQVEP